MATPEFLCASSDGTGCVNEAKYTCQNCRLVAYCGPSCQKAHWSTHKRDCKSPLNSLEWQPQNLINEAPTPAKLVDIDLLAKENPENQTKGEKFLWGNTPAIDVLKLESNEGVKHDEDLRILFAASGDLRNLVKTIGQLPDTYRGSLEITLNDRDIDVVARNLILIYIAIAGNHLASSIDSIIHIWYSALVRELELIILHHKLRPMVQAACSEIKNNPYYDEPRSTFARTWGIGKYSLKLWLNKPSWNSLLSRLDVPLGLTAERAQQMRTASLVNPAAVDYFERFMCLQPPSHRVASKKFQYDGLLLPFGSSRQEFQVPNPTLFGQDHMWLPSYSADPLNGWSADDVCITSSGPATADLYGKLHFHLREELRKFLTRLSTLNVSFILLQTDACSLRNNLKEDVYDRVDRLIFVRTQVSNISDLGFLGIPKTLYYTMPLLRSPRNNPHATLITKFMNAVDEILHDPSKKPDLASQKRAAAERISQYLPLDEHALRSLPGALQKYALGLTMLTHYDNAFNCYAEYYQLQSAADQTNAVRKEPHTIVDKWPTRLKLQPGQPGAQEEFDRHILRSVRGTLRYVEWQRRT
ncbi:uncharacterized protein DSM5745_04850 [Aspergillus mulundensis]|uniref:MYND-type domain-containing protein n=1 Tax=Aspergillus mulundensis TaxID=1810919 RepID=A0A3D8S4R8_9EURO|nr:hypothetical protein DSM5745_04850 [Aspergillus mulundensis]RDW81293.1 hypothetical protein DSM5745_04850 [Aspergillus mulundensis]